MVCSPSLVLESELIRLFYKNSVGSIYVERHRGPAAAHIATADPHNSLFAVFSLVMGPLALGDAVALGKAAQARRGMNEADVANLGETVAQKAKLVQKVTGVCLRGGEE